MKSAILWTFLCLSGFAHSSVLDLSIFKKRSNTSSLKFDIHENQPYAVLGNKNKLVKRDSGNADLQLDVSFNQLYYLAELKFGSNQQAVTVLIDTGSSDLIINSATNPSCQSDNQEEDAGGDSDDASSIYKRDDETNPQYCLVDNDDQQDSYPVLNRTAEAPEGSETYYNNIEDKLNPFYTCSYYGLFDSENSSTLVNTSIPLDIQYWDGTTYTGNFVQDDVFVGGVKIPNITFGLSDSGDKPSGILGLGFENNESVYQNGGDKYNNFVATLKNEGYINKQLYSFFGSHKYQSQNSIIFGGYDKNAFDPSTGLTLVPIINYSSTSKRGDGPYYLSITLNSISFKNSSFENPLLIASGNAPAILDIGSSVSSLPYYIYNEIIVRFGFEWSSQITSYVIADSKIPKNDSFITFNFQNCLIKIPVIAFTYPVVDGETLSNTGMRMLSINTHSGDDFILGDDFLGYIYFIADLDLKNIAIGQSNPNYSGKSIVEVENEIPDAVKSSNWDYVYGSDNMFSLKLKHIDDPNSVKEIPDSEFNENWQYYYAGIGNDLGW